MLYPLILKREKGAGAEHDEKQHTQEKHDNFQNRYVFVNHFHDNIPPLVSWQDFSCRESIVLFYCWIMIGICVPDDAFFNCFSSLSRLGGSKGSNF
jgi:hypothetical protein